MTRATTPFSAYAQHGSYTEGAGISITAAVTYNSDNMWLPLTSQRQVHVEFSGGTMLGDHSGRIELIGYR